MAHQPDDLTGRRRQLGEAPAAHARVELQVDADAFRDRLVEDGQVEVGLARLRDVAARARPHDEDPHARELAAERKRLGDRGDAERQRAFAERRAGDVDGAVPVAVGLDDGPELGAPERAPQPADVPPDRAEVDRDLGAVHRVLTRRAPWAARRADRSRSCPRRAKPRSPPSGEPSQPRPSRAARPCPWRGRRRRSP